MPKRPKVKSSSLTDKKMHARVNAREKPLSARVYNERYSISVRNIIFTEEYLSNPWKLTPSLHGEKQTLFLQLDRIFENTYVTAAKNEIFSLSFSLDSQTKRKLNLLISLIRIFVYITLNILVTEFLRI